MTLIMTVLVGAGILFIASALDDTPIVTTFQKIISGQTINWAGATTTTTTGTPPPIINPGQATLP